MFTLCLPRGKEPRSKSEYKTMLQRGLELDPDNVKKKKKKIAVDFKYDLL